ncbi:MAG: MFS transporter [Anaerolineae bacterium]|nr:MAG: MFS transporter [Anaerolineae bacterium]
MTESDGALPQRWAPPFFTIWTGQAFSLFGSQLVQFALIWYLTQQTGSATVLATASLVGMLPQIVIGPFAGALVDRWSRRVVMMASDSLVALATLLLAVLFALGVVQIWHIYVLLGVRAIAGAFQWPAMQAATSLMVPKEHLSRIQGLNQMLNGAMSIVAAPLGALLMDLLPMQGILAIDVSTAFFAVTPLFFIRVPEPEHRVTPQAEKPSVWADVRAGVAYVWRWPGLAILLGMALLLNFLLTPAFSLLPLLVKAHFGKGALELGWMEAVSGVGMVLGGLLLSVWGGFKKRILTSFSGLVLMGFSALALGLASPQGFLLALAAMFALGVLNPLVNGPIFAVLQSVVDADMQGRIFMLVSSAASAISPLGLVLAGPLADRLGVQVWFLAGGVLTVVTGVAAFFIPAIVNIEESQRAAAVQAGAAD